MNKRRILKSLKKVFDKRDIKYLSEEAYDFVENISGFIAHYNKNGFKDYYSDFDLFIKDLRNSTDILNPEYYLEEFFMKRDPQYYQDKVEILTWIKNELEVIKNE